MDEMVKARSSADPELTSFAHVCEQWAALVVKLRVNLGMSRHCTYPCNSRDIAARRQKEASYTSAVRRRPCRQNG